MVLHGWEVKAILAGSANFNGGSAFIRISGGEAWLEAMTLTPLAASNQGLLVTMEPNRPRKLLLHRSEINKLYRKVAERGYTVVPLVVTKGRKLKLKIGLAKGKTLFDKRDTLRKRDLLREQQREAAIG